MMLFEMAITIMIKSKRISYLPTSRKPECEVQKLFKPFYCCWLGGHPVLAFLSFPVFIYFALLLSYMSQLG